jgi:flavorubredoxin
MIREITNNLYYVGVNDNTKVLFERLWPLPYGVSYNAYLIKDNYNVLIDTVEYPFNQNFFDYIKEVIADENIDYVVVNHMEPDHSSSLLQLIEKYPEIKIVGNKKTIDMLNGFYGITNNVYEVKDGDKIELGERTLSFHLTPMVHWPETMMTYVEGEGILFSGDAFGAFGSLQNGIMDVDADMTLVTDEMYRYYSNIVGKYGGPVEKAIEKLSSLPINYICSTHGPIWHEKIGYVVENYLKMARYESEEGVVIAYGSMYGHTADLAKNIYNSLIEAGIKNVVIHDLSDVDASFVLRDVFKYNTLILGSPTYNSEIFPKVADLTVKLEGRMIKNKTFSCFASYSWAGQAVKRLTAFAERMQWNIVEPKIEIKQAGLNVNVKALSRELAENIIKSMRN